MTPPHRIAAVLYDRCGTALCRCGESRRAGGSCPILHGESWLVDADAVIRELDSHGWPIDPVNRVKRHQNRVNDVLKTSNHSLCVRGCQ